MCFMLFLGFARFIYTYIYIYAYYIYIPTYVIVAIVMVIANSSHMVCATKPKAILIIKMFEV